MSRLVPVLREWLEYAQTGSNDTDRYGLCSYVLMNSNGLGACEELEAALVRDFGGNTTPFNADYSDYLQDAFREVHHLNPARIAWVKSYIELTAGP